MNRHFRYTPVLTALLLLLLIAAPVGTSLLLGSASAATLQSAATIYLPLTVRGGSSTPPTTVPTDPPTGGSAGNGAFWLPFTTQDGNYVLTENPYIAIDARGGIHVTYRIVLGNDNGHWPAYYMYCPNTCNDPTHWTRTRLGDNVFDSRIQLDAAGHPRIMLYVYVSNDGTNAGLKEYQYAACDAGCTQSANWTITPIADAISYDENRPDSTFHYFALDGQGHPGFIYNDTTNHDNHGGTFYDSCRGVSPSDCTNASNWTETRLTDATLWNPELAYGANNEPRFVATYINRETNFDKMLYAECTDNCAQVSNAWLYNAAGYTSYSLRLNSNGEPRIGLFTGMASGALESNQLYYAWCNTGCTNAANWQAANLHSQNHNPMTVDMALDTQDHPRIAYKQGDAGPGYAWCNNGCESNGGQWHGVLMEDASTLQQDNPLNGFIECSNATWTGGHLTQLALDPQGNPRVVFDTKHQYSGVNLLPGHKGETCDADTDVIVSRFLMMNQP